MVGCRGGLGEAVESAVGAGVIIDSILQFCDQKGVAEGQISASPHISRPKQPDAVFPPGRLGSFG